MFFFFSLNIWKHSEIKLELPLHCIATKRINVVSGPSSSETFLIKKTNIAFVALQFLSHFLITNMTETETTIVHLYLKNLPTKYFVHRPNMFGKKKKHFFLTAVKTVMLKLSPICRRFDEKSCKIHVCSHSSSMPPFWIDFRSRKSLEAEKTLFVYPSLGRHSPQTSGFSKIRFRGLGRSF